MKAFFFFSQKGVEAVLGECRSIIVATLLSWKYSLQFLGKSFNYIYNSHKQNKVLISHY